MNEKTKDVLRYCLTCATIGIGGCLLLGLVTLLGFGHPNCEPTVEGYTWFWLTMWACFAGASAGSVPVACAIMWITGKAYRCFS